MFLRPSWLYPWKKDRTKVPDDAHIVYSANGRLNLRRLDQIAATPIRGTEGAPTSPEESARSPFFSPDGQWVGFWQNGQLKKVSVTGGAAVVLCAADNPWGASWSADDSIVFGQGAKGIMRVAAAGGTPELVVKVDSGESAHGPQMLPGVAAFCSRFDRQAHRRGTKRELRFSR
jgi:serine/threonine-protein kinase